MALNRQIRIGALKRSPLRAQVAAISCGLTNVGAVADLDYAEDSNAKADANFVLTAENAIVEIQGTAEGVPFSETEFLELMRLAKLGTAQLFDIQKRALESIA